MRVWRGALAREWFGTVTAECISVLTAGEAVTMGSQGLLVRDRQVSRWGGAMAGEEGVSTWDLA